MAGIFDFAPTTHFASEIPPPEQDVVSMNGWDFTATSGIPYRAKFKLVLGGMRWRLNVNGTALDETIDPLMNAGRLLNFYKANRKSGTFTYNHEYLGAITCRFAEPVVIPQALVNSNGLVPDFEITLVHHNPGY